MKIILLISIIVYLMFVFSALRLAKESDKDMEEIYLDRKDNKNGRI